MTDKLTAADVLRIVADVAASVQRPVSENLFETPFSDLAQACRDEAARREAVEKTPADVPDSWVRRRVYKNSQEHKGYLDARFNNNTVGTFEYDGHRWRYEYTSFDDKGDYDVIVRPQSQPDAPPPPADDLVARLDAYLCRFTKDKNLMDAERLITASKDAIEALRARVAALEGVVSASIVDMELLKDAIIDKDPQNEVLLRIADIDRHLKQALAKGSANG